MEPIGRIYGEVVGSDFKFASRKYYSCKYVRTQNRHDDSIIIGKVTEVRVKNHFLERPEIIRYIDDTMDYERDTIYSYSVLAIGAIRNGKLTRDRAYALPGMPVTTASANELAQVYGIENTDIKVGYLRDARECTVCLEVNKIFRPHMTVIGRTGSGKSYFVKGIIKKLQGVRYFVFSPSDEYNNVPENKDEKVCNEIVLPLLVENIRYYLGLNISEELILQKIPFDDHIYSTQEIIKEIIAYYDKKQKGDHEQLKLNLGQIDEKDVQIPQYAQSLIQKFRSIRNLKFSKEVSKQISIKNSTIFDMSACTQLEQECIINYYLYRILQACKKTKESSRKKNIIFIEEAHNFVPSMKSTLCKTSIVNLAREGRKYDISLCFITQRPRNFDQTALSQSSNKVIFSLPHPDDIKHIMEDAVYYHTEMGNIIQRQRQGQCVIIGDAFESELETEILF